MNIFCIGHNYIAHTQELNSAIPTEPVVFMKPATPLQPFNYPSFSHNVHYECELVIEICKSGKNIPEEEASAYWNNITLGLDFTARDLQYKLKDKGLPWEKCKAFDGSAHIGSWIHKSDLKNLTDIEFSFFKNNKLMQHGFSSNMIFSFEKLIADLSMYFHLHPGDIVFTGTPEGVGAVLPNDHLIGILEDRTVFDIYA